MYVSALNTYYLMVVAELILSKLAGCRRRDVCCRFGCIDQILYIQV